jgi:hypothetical protein
VGGKNLQQHCKMLLIYYNNVVFIIFSLNNRYINRCLIFRVWYENKFVRAVEAKSIYQI